MRYIAALDHDHLDNGIFLTSFARSLSELQKNKNLRSIIVHTDSAYTDRVMQTGVMRDEATIRSMKDLNKRLVALFADEGVSTIGLNPYKKNFITLKDGKLSMDHTLFEGLTNRSVLLISSLVQNLDDKEVEAIDLASMITFLQKELNADELFIFSKSDEAEIFTQTDMPDILSWQKMSSSFRQKEIPDDLSSLNYRVRLATARDFNQLPSLNNTILIE
ncbi:MAG TPA: hypothetical protein VK112_01015 [Fodinibius sp.]|nr:hypothetical protein [Fodinibius sp.]